MLHDAPALGAAAVAIVVNVQVIIPAVSATAITLRMALSSAYLLPNSRDLQCKAEYEMAPRDELWGHLVCVPLAGIEPATYDIVRALLYPLSYSGTQG